MGPAGEGRKTAGRRWRGDDRAARERLLSSAIAFFNRKGYAATTVREIVADAGVTKPVLYYYFRNKEGIFLELMRGAWSRFEELVGAAASAPGGPRERLVGLSRGLFELFLERIEVARLMYAVYYGPPQGAPFFDFDPYHRRFQEVVRKIVAEGIESGEFRKGSADEMAWAVIGAVNVALELQLCRPERGIGADGLERVLDVIFRGMAAETARARRLKVSAGSDRRRRAAGTFRPRRERSGR